ncbi:OmpA family protein [bacterium]|nr:OmpA family protein [bacterium]
MRKVLISALLVLTAAFAYNTNLGNRGTYNVYSGSCEDMGMLTIDLNALGTMINIQDTVIGNDTVTAQLTEVLPYFGLSFTPWHYLEFGLWGHGRYATIGNYSSAVSDFYNDLGLSVKGGIPIYFNENNNLYIAPGIDGFAYMHGLGTPAQSYGFGGLGLFTFNAAWFGIHLNGGYEYITGPTTTSNVLGGAGLEIWPFKFAGIIVDGTARIPSNDFANFANYLRVTPGLRFGFGGRVVKFNINLGAELEPMQTPFRWHALAGFGLGFDLMPSKEGLISGLVVDKETQKPIEGAKISIEGSSDIEPYTTGPDGRFTISRPSGEYTLLAEHPDYLATKTASELIELEGGTVMLELSKYSAGATVVGVVSDAVDGDPISAVLSFVNISADTIISSFKSDPVSGYYRAIVPAGTYKVNVEANAYKKSHKSMLLKEADELVVDFRLEKSAEGPQPKPLVFPVVYFGRGEVFVSPKNYAMLQQVVDILKTNPYVKIELQGNTDSVGDSESNYYVSVKRAESVKSFLVGNGISSDRISVVGFGESRPRGNNRTRVGQDMNRRVDIIAL